MISPEPHELGPAPTVKTILDLVFTPPTTCRSSVVIENSQDGQNPEQTAILRAYTAKVNGKTVKRLTIF